MEMVPYGNAILSQESSLTVSRLTRSQTGSHGGSSDDVAGASLDALREVADDALRLLIEVYLDEVWMTRLVLLEDVGRAVVRAIVADDEFVRGTFLLEDTVELSL